MAAKKTDKPTEYRQFEELAKGLLEVPKAALDKNVQRYDANKRRKKKKRA
ncbi:MAG TPA: hypothetical protein VGG64_22950 [Pirellulales bacterium]|jgi:hypothetical protein